MLENASPAEPRLVLRRSFVRNVKGMTGWNVKRTDVETVMPILMTQINTAGYAELQLARGPIIHIRI